MGSEKVTQLLMQVSGGNRAAVDELIPMVYKELKRIAGGQLRNERPGHTLQATALVHEAYLKLVDQREVNWQNRAHFFGVAAQAMRRIMLDYAKSRKRVKRGGDVHKTSLDEAMVVGRRPRLRTAATSTKRSPAWRSWIRARRRWSSCASSAASRWKRRPKPWASPRRPSSASGPWRRRGCIASFRTA